VKLQVTEQAANDLRYIENYIGEDNPKAAVQFVAKLTTRMQDLLHSPLSGRKRDELAPGLRSVTVGNYLIFYRQETDAIVVIHVLHGYQNLPEIFKTTQL